jgi:hypothetical protein
MMTSDNGHSTTNSLGSKATIGNNFGKVPYQQPAKRLSGTSSFIPLVDIESGKSEMRVNFDEVRGNER